MLKEPRPGRVKTRLGREIGMVAAAAWYRRHTRRLIRALRDPRWDVVLAVSPDRTGLTSHVWPFDLERITQGPGDLGDRMGRLLRRHQPGPALIVGSDIPGISRNVIARAFTRLNGADAVIGPAPDGGYWLIGWCGTRSVPARLFQGVRWSTSHAMSDTLRSLSDCRVAIAETLADVDTSADLRDPFST